LNQTPEKDFPLLRNLKDAGCDAEMVGKFFQLRDEGKIPTQLRLLMQHRRNLLQTLHENQNKIDCLDYLIHQTKPKQDGASK